MVLGEWDFALISFHVAVKGNPSLLNSLLKLLDGVTEVQMVLGTVNLMRSHYQPLMNIGEGILLGGWYFFFRRC